MSSKYLIITVLVFYTLWDIKNVRLGEPPVELQNTNLNNQINSVSQNDTVSNSGKGKNSINQAKKPVPDYVLSKVPQAAVQKEEHIVITLGPAQKKPETTRVEQTPPQQAPPSQQNISLTTDTFIRAFYVFMGFGVVVLVYLGIKTIRVNQPPTSDSTVRKYGVKAKRGDLEMLPLPLAEDEDDDTLFDVGNHVRTGN